MNEADKIALLTRHTDNVSNNCQILGQKLIAAGQPDLGRQLIANGRIHDYSKFFGIEWQFMVEPGQTNRAGLKNAVEHHQRTNMHHPEYWFGIAHMPTVYRYEMIADITARSAEMGGSCRDFVENQIPKKYGIPVNGEIHKQLLNILDMLCEKPFEPIEPEPEVKVKIDETIMAATKIP